jgi:hypothetical protein
MAGSANNGRAFGGRGHGDSAWRKGIQDASCSTCSSSKVSDICRIVIAAPFTATVRQPYTLHSTGLSYFDSSPNGNLFGRACLQSLLRLPWSRVNIRIVNRTKKEKSKISIARRIQAQPSRRT